MEVEQVKNFIVKFHDFFVRSLFFYLIFSLSIVIDLCFETGTITGIIAVFSGIYGVLCTFISSYFGLIMYFVIKNKSWNFMIKLLMNLVVVMVTLVFACSNINL